MKNLHIFSYDNNEKFSKPFIRFINKHFDEKEHFFLLTSGNDYTPSDSQESNVSILPYNIFSIKKLLGLFKEYDKIFLHGLSGNKYIEISLLLCPSVLSRCYWCIWGGDLYSYKQVNRNIKAKIRNSLRKIIIRDMGHFITHVKGDYELAQKWYSAKGKYHYSFMYLSNTFSLNINKNIKEKEVKEKKYILIGNSGLNTNNHFDILEKLRNFSETNMVIICPLSYAHESNSEYKAMVINKGKELFGEKFIPLTEFMPFEKYLEILDKVDIAIFNHKRQQALGNITTLLGLGKKVYIREEITTWQFCKDHDLKVYSANDNYDDLFEEMDEGIRQKNIENVKSKFSEEKLVEDLKQIFDEEIN